MNTPTPKNTPPLVEAIYAPVSDEVLLRIIDEYSAPDARDVLLAMHGVTREMPRESPWPWVAFWLSAGAFFCALAFTR